MSGFRLGLTHYVNYGPFEDAWFDFSLPGMTMVEGIIKGRRGCTSNGSGKSYLYDGPVWALYDRCLREKYTKDDVIRLLFRNVGGNVLEVIRDPKGRPKRPKNGCYVEQHLIGPVPAKVVRYRGHPAHGNKVRLWIDEQEVTRGRDAMTNEAIEQLLGMDYRTFVNCAAFGAREDVKSFFAAGDAGRKEILEKLLGLEVYADAEKIARTRVRKLASERDPDERAREALQVTITRQEELVARLLDSDELSAMRWRFKKTRLACLCLAWEIERQEARVETAATDLQEELDATAQLREAHELRVRQVQQKRSETERELRKADTAQAEAEAELRQVQRQVESWERLAGQKCPTCLQTVPAQAALRIKHQARQTAALATDARAEAVEVVESCTHVLESLDEPEPPRLWLAEALDDAHRQEQARLRDLQHQLSKATVAAESAEREFTRARRQSERAEDELTRMRGDLSDLDTKLEESQREMDRLSFWVEAFGNGGIKSFLIESEVPEINRRATGYAQRLLGPGAVVRLEATTELKTGAVREQLNVVGAIPGCTETYAGASKGQKKRLDLALLLAFREVVAERSTKSFDQLLADELFDGLDPAGEESVIELLRELSADCPVVLVTHSAGLKSAADRIVTVRHENGVATVES